MVDIRPDRLGIELPTYVHFMHGGRSCEPKPGMNGGMQVGGGIMYW